MGPGESPAEARRWRERGAQLRREGRLAEAIEALRRALEAAPDDALALNELAHALRWQGKLADARAAAVRAATLSPGLAEAWFNLGAVQISEGTAVDAVESYRKALDLKPDFAEAWSNLGEALGATGDPGGAISAYRRAVAANPGLAPAWSNLGKALLEAGDRDEAVDACRSAVTIAPEFAVAWVNLGNALLDRGDFREAVLACERAAELDPQSAEAWTNLGSAQMELGDLESAVAAQLKALGLAPNSARAHYNLGLAHERRLEPEAAMKRYRRAVAIDPEFPAAWIRIAALQLMHGNFAEGWATYEWRWRDRGARERRYDFASWKGERVSGCRLLIWGEQGLGDEILHASMVGELVESGLHVTLETDHRLVPLMRRSFQGAEIVSRTDPPSIAPGAHDFQCPLAGLGRWLRPSFEAFARNRPFLVADTERAREYSARLRGSTRDTLVGISWGSANRDYGASKSCPLPEWSAVLASPGVRFVDLQYGDTRHVREDVARRLGIDIRHLDDLDLTNDIDGLAALCAACDLVITVSNVTAHLAGALGRPVWLLAPLGKGRIWYWFHGRRYSPWYPSMRIFDQLQPGRWRETLDRVAGELASFVSSTR